MFLRDFFYLNKSDRKVIIFLLFIGIIAFVLFHVLGKGEHYGDEVAEDSLYMHNRPISSVQKSQRVVYYQQGQEHVAELFAFDPNTADSTQLLRLGLRPWQVRNIYKYRAAGGVYRKSTDFARLYGLTQKQYRALEPYIRIGSDYQPAAMLVEKAIPVARDTLKYPVKMAATERLRLNLADTVALQKVPGIGRYYAREIVNYRTRLGGFYSAQQLLEIEGFPVDALKYFEIGGEEVKKLNVNRLTLSQLRRHPYINFYQARAITDYRRLKGELRKLDDLRLLKEFTDRDLARIGHYVEF